MAVLEKNVPYHGTHPGSTLRDELEERGMTQTELAIRLGMAKQTVSKIINGIAPVSEDTAIALERVLDVPAYFWLALEASYRAYVQTQEQRVALASHVGWVGNFPYKEMAELGWVEDTRKRVDRLLSLLCFLGINTPAEWPSLLEHKKYSAYRSSTAADVNEFALCSWLIQGEHIAHGQTARQFKSSTLRHILPELRRLTIESPAVVRSELLRLCSNAGVMLVFVPAIPKLGVWGAARWLSADKPMIQLSNRYRMDDHFWFTFFHEVFHILLHRNKTIFECDNAGSASSEMETEANDAAGALLIPDSMYWSFVERREPRTRERVIELARELNIAPGIIVGRLQREKWVSYNNAQLNELKRDFSVLFPAVA